MSTIIPDVEWLDQIFLAVEVIKSRKPPSIFSKVGHSLSLCKRSSKHEPNHIDGSSIGILHPEPKVALWVNELNFAPQNTVIRIQLARYILEVCQEQENLANSKFILVQSTLPVFLGELSFQAIQMAFFGYANYLEKLSTSLKKKVLEVRSPHLQHVSLKKLELLPNSPGKPIRGGLIERQLAIVSGMEKQVQLSLKTLKLQWLGDFTLKEIDLFTVTFQAELGWRRQHPMSAHRKKEWNDLRQRKRRLCAKAIATLNCLKGIPFFHPLCLEITSKVIRLDPMSNIAHILEGRVYMKAVKEYLRRLEVGDQEVLEHLVPTFNKSVVAYRRALKRTSLDLATSRDLPVLVEFAGLARFAFMHRTLMKFTKKGLADLLKQARKAIASAILIEARYTPVQHTINRYLETLERRA